MIFLVCAVRTELPCPVWCSGCTVVLAITVHRLYGLGVRLTPLSSWFDCQRCHVSFTRLLKFRHRVPVRVSNWSGWRSAQKVILDIVFSRTCFGNFTLSSKFLCGGLTKVSSKSRVVLVHGHTVTSSVTSSLQYKQVGCPGYSCLSHPTAGVAQFAPDLFYEEPCQRWELLGYTGEDVRFFLQKHAFSFSLSNPFGISAVHCKLIIACSYVCHSGHS